jgi:hypothetical protein
MNLNFTEENLSVLSNKLHIGGVSCDLAKISDCVNHELLLVESKQYFLWNSKKLISDLNNRILITESNK